jgi:hypothetical protein
MTATAFLGALMAFARMRGEKVSLVGIVAPELLDDPMCNCGVCATLPAGAGKCHLALACLYGFTQVGL